MGNAYKIFVGIPEGKNYAKDQGTDGKITLERILEK
jgi:hypothetical protein